MTDKKLKCYAEMTKYPDVYDECYWGAFQYNPDATNHIDAYIFENRNRFAEEYNLGCSRGMERFKELMGNLRRGMSNQYMDHLETYRTKDGKYVAIVSPYSPFESHQELLTEIGFTQIYELYGKNTPTWIKVIDNYRDIKPYYIDALRKIHNKGIRLSAEFYRDLIKYKIVENWSKI